MSAEDAIGQVVAAYLDGLYRCDTALLAEVFHPAALYATATGGELVALNLADYLAVVAQRDPPARTGAPRKERIVRIEFAGPDTALVKLECRFFQKDYVDFLMLVRVEARWRIISKVFHYEAAAAPVGEVPTA
ncbi:MAG: nuclear transport factor 2 family protein [Thiobacillus sp.]|nr:nuclear transport factor 2 family protein [Thiobacillus sp.]